MCHRFDFDNLISLIGAWFLLILTLGLYYLIWSIFEYFHQRKHSVASPFIEIFIDSLDELKPSYWWSC